MVFLWYTTCFSIIILAYYPNKILNYLPCSLQEIAALTNTPRNESEGVLDQMVNQGLLEETKTKNDSIWRIIQKGN